MKISALEYIALSIKKEPLPPHNAIFFITSLFTCVCLISSKFIIFLSCFKNKILSTGSSNSPTKPEPIDLILLSRIYI